MQNIKCPGGRADILKAEKATEVIFAIFLKIRGGMRGWGVERKGD